MSENFYTILTATGKAKLANSAVLGSKVNFKTLKVGDGNGAYYEPTESQTSLVREVWSGNVSSISVDENNPNWIVAETLIPATIGGFFIREAGIFDEDGDLIAISKLSQTYKPVVSEGSIKDLCIKIVLEVSNVSSVTLKIDPTVIVATRKDIDVLQAKMDASNSQTVEEIKELDSKLSEQISELANEISNKTVVTPSIGYGMNNVIKNAGKTSVSPKFTIQGKTVINLLGKDGNCEDISKWTGWNSTLVLDSDNKVFGNNSIKITSTSTMSNMAKAIKWNTSKYYCASAYLKNGNFPHVSLCKEANGGGVFKESQQVTDTTKFSRVFIKLQPSELYDGNNLYVAGAISSGQYAYADGIMLEEITQSQYNDPNFVPSPYVDGYACLQNPYIEVRHDNLVRNGNCEEGIAWWTPNTTDTTITQYVLSNGYFQISRLGSQGWSGINQSVAVKPDTSYLASCIFKTSGITVNGADILIYQSRDGKEWSWLATSPKVTESIDTPVSIAFTPTMPYVQIIVGLENTNAGAIAYAKNIAITEGTMTPDSYKPCRIERCVVEGKFADGDSLVLENGEVTGQINWKHKTLFGKDYDWQFNQDLTGYKTIYLLNSVLQGATANGTIVKYDGKIMPKVDIQTASDSCIIQQSQGGATYINVADSETGWTESISPNNDEVKAFMNGWKTLAYTENRYTVWVSIVDGSLPSKAIKSTINANSSGNVLSVSSGGTQFANGDTIAVITTTGLLRSYMTVSGTTTDTSIPLLGNTNGVYSGDIVIKADNGSTNIGLLNYCKNNVAPNYEGYQLHYKLQNPEPLNDVNTHIHGDIPKFDIGDNYLYFDSGIVLGEVVNPLLGSGYANINVTGYGTSCYLKYKNEKINTIFKNSIFDTKANIYSRVGGDVNISIVGYGFALINQTDFDPSATYTADYKILSTIAPQISCFICNYEQNIVTAINKLEDSVNNKQVHDTILDQIVDLSLYERVVSPVRNYFKIGSNVFIDFFIPFSPKKVKPTLTIQSLYVNINGIGECSAKFLVNTISILSNCVRITYYTSDTTIVSNLMSYGGDCVVTSVLDCRSRI